MSGGVSAARGKIRQLEADVEKYLGVINKYRAALNRIANIDEESETEAVGIARDTLGLHGEPHSHTCQQCDSVVVDNCECNHPSRGMYWCSANCKAAFDL